MSEKTTFGRLAERGTTERAVVEAILDEGFVCHVAYITGNRPVVIPTLYARDNDHLLIHGSNSMGIAKAVRGGSPLSVAVTHLDGLVVARTGFHSSANYRSVVVHGEGEILEGTEHETALDLIVEALIPGRLDDIRPNTGSEAKQTSVIRLSLDESSAKVREGDPIDDEEDIGTGVWAGVLPFSLVAGEPIPASDLEDSVETPDYLLGYRR